MHIHLIVAARPNFIKAAPLYKALVSDARFKPVLIHTGQHFDKNMCDVFFDELDLPNPDIQLGIHGGSNTEQIGKVMMAYEKACQTSRPDLIVVMGDVNATLSCAVTAKRLDIPVAHLEAGIRSNDMSMPEEINRRVTDSVCDWYWTPSKEANDNLAHEGALLERIVFVGNIMIDSLRMMKASIDAKQTHRRYALQEKRYLVMTYHRPSNVDTQEKLEDLITVLKNTVTKIPVIFPIHPRTEKNLIRWGLLNQLTSLQGLILTQPMPYTKFMSLIVNCKGVMTDSGGIQEETTYLGIPCLTFRENTERPITISEGTNTLVNMGNVDHMIDLILQDKGKHGRVPDYWDGHTSERVVDFLIDHYSVFMPDTRPDDPR